MDNFINLAKQGLQAMESGQGGPQQSGGAEYNAPHGGQGQGQMQGHPADQIDHDEAVRTASSQGSGDSGMFSQAMSFMHQNKQEHAQPVDEEHVQNAHAQAYQQGNAGSLSAGSMGSAAAMQVLKQFTSGSGGGGGGGNMQTQMISMAMAEASKLFDSAGGASGGNKQDAVNSAAMTVMKLMVQSKFSSMTGGGNSGGLGGLMGMAMKFA